MLGHSSASDSQKIALITLLFACIGQAVMPENGKNRLTYSIFICSMACFDFCFAKGVIFLAFWPRFVPHVKGRIGK